MLTFGIDWDDVISPLNDCAIELANEEYHFEPPLIPGKIQGVHR